ncbi:transposase [Dictyobacter formicarum]|uniref:Transposase IS4-like domain-containing protein n=1 Tax=Dictyobacter formicarum TaxID=2778368 RepID=A0ABQ3VLE2_9CHLR|nr:hypothetical protein KSZ_50410 [Dictyobacter formicarum]
MNLYEAHTGIVLKEQMVAEKEHELSRIETFLTPVLMKGRLLSADALFTQRHVCQQVVAAGGDYLLFVKQNQPSLHQDLALFF